MDMCFVAVSVQGEAPKPGHSFAVRSHVRKAIAKEKLSRLRPAQYKFVSQEPGAKKLRRTRRPSGNRNLSQTDQGQTSGAIDIPQTISPHCSTDTSNDHAESNDDLKPVLPQKSCDSLQPSLTCTHPYAILAGRYLDSTPQRLDYLFKSRGFREAAEPLFDTTHVDSVLSMTAVFPNCLEDSVFFHALMYSILQSHNRGVATFETYRVKEKMLAALKKTLLQNRNCTSQSSLAAIMLLRGTAYKWEDYKTHQLHAQGLMRALESCQEYLTPATQRAFFWQDLCASLLINAPIQCIKTVLPSRMFSHWTTEGSDRCVPLGFLRHQAVLPKVLLECIVDCKKLQTAASIHWQDADDKNLQLDSMQASIETRLVQLEVSCKGAGMIASAVRLAIFIVCYVSWTETWDSSLIPARLAEQLLKILETSFTGFGGSGFSVKSKGWQGRHDLQLWVTLIGLNTSTSAGGYVDGLRERYGRLLRLYGHSIGATKWSDQEDGCDAQHIAGLNQFVHSALNDYIYPEGSLERRLQIMEWFELELLMNTIVLQDTYD